MKVRDEVLLVEPPVHRDASVPTAAEIEQAERLISDLTALLDAGLIEVCESVLGPIRYGAA